MFKYVDMGSLIVIIVTFVLFALALVTKGFTHDLLLEAGVFLVSVKLIIMAYRNTVNNQMMARELLEIKTYLQGKDTTHE